MSTRIRPHALRPGNRGRPGERGSVMVWALLLGMLVAALVVSSRDVAKATQGRMDVQFSVHGQAFSVAHAGIVDAHAWLRRQPVQPVSEFAPRVDPTADPPIDETDDPAIGLVREFEITPGVWGRYEVIRGRPMDPFVDTNGNGVYDEGEPFTDLLAPPGGGPRTMRPDAASTDGAVHDGYGDGRWTPSLWTRDVSAERGLAGLGTMWRIEGRGLVFMRPDLERPLGQGPNRLLASRTLVTEARRLLLALPATAAICAPSLGRVTLHDRVRLRSDQLGVAVGSSSGSLVVTSGAEILAPSVSAVIPGYAAAVEDVFGVDFALLKSMADVSTYRAGGVPPMIRAGHLVVIERDVTYDETHPLRGQGILVVRGDLTIAAGSSSFFTGLVYVDGDVRVHAPAFIRGTLVVTGSVRLEGSSGDYVEIQQDSATATAFLMGMSTYRLARATYSTDLTDAAILGARAGAGAARVGVPREESEGKDLWEGMWSGWGDRDEDLEELAEGGS
jgi:hypothetical protein